MLKQILLMMSQTAAEATPAFTSLTLTTLVAGLCPSQPAAIRLTWTATNFNSAVHDYAVYRDGILVSTQDGSPFTVLFPGQAESISGTPVTFNYRVDIVRTSDGAVLATQSVSATKKYREC